MYDLVVIGTGPAGLFCAINCASHGMRVCILETNSSAAKKFLLSGSGQCNITNSAEVADFMIHYGSSGRFVKPSLFNFSNKDLISYFENKKIGFVQLNNGKLFPESLRAQDLLDVLLSECAIHNIEIRYDEPTVSIKKSDDIFIIETGIGRYESTECVIATGGKSYPSTGSTGDGYIFAKALGHTITETAPSLTSVIIRDYSLQECAGISIREGVARLYRDGKKIKEQSGDILFTHKGLSGPAILDMSRYIKPDDCIRVQLTDYGRPDEFEEILIEGSLIAGNKSVKNYISDQSIPERIVTAIMASTSIAIDMTMSHLDKKSRRMLAELVTGMPFIVERLGDYNEAMATRGGISIAEVNPKSMESKIVPGLYFAGEVLDVDGDTGGYNIQFAFSSGKCAADHIVSKHSGKTER